MMQRWVISCIKFMLTVQRNSNALTTFLVLSQTIDILFLRKCDSILTGAASPVNKRICHWSNVPRMLKTCSPPGYIHRVSYHGNRLSIMAWFKWTNYEKWNTLSSTLFRFNTSNDFIQSPFELTCLFDVLFSFYFNRNSTLKLLWCSTAACGQSCKHSYIFTKNIYAHFIHKSSSKCFRRMLIRSSLNFTM